MLRSFCRRQTQARGFTLVEVLVSLAVIAIALFGVMGSIAYGTRHARSGEELGEAVQLARQVLVYIQESSVLDTVEPTEPWFSEDSGLNDATTVRRELDAAPLGGLAIPLVQLERYQRRVVATRLSDNPSDHRYGLARVTVEIFWESKQGWRRLELSGVVSHARP